MTEEALAPAKQVGQVCPKETARSTEELATLGLLAPQGPRRVGFGAKPQREIHQRQVAVIKSPACRGIEAGFDE